MISQLRKNIKNAMHTLPLYIRVLIALGLLVPAFAYAQSGSAGAGINATVEARPATVQAQTSVTAQATTSSPQNSAVTARAKTKASQEIDRRIKTLQELSARVDAMKKVTTDFKQNLKNNTNVQVQSLQQLKAKIQAEANAEVLKTDVQSITRDYRIYALTVPMTRIAAAADREATIINMLLGVGLKLQARLEAAQTAGADITALATALNDMGAKLQSAQARAQAAVNAVGPLAPDGGDKAKMDANAKALKTAQGEIKAAHQDIVAARKSMQTVLSGLNSLSVGASASTSVRSQ